MALISKTVPGAFGGVSQIVSELREITEVNKMENCYSTIGFGTTARPKLNKQLTFPFTIIDNFSFVVNHEISGVITEFLYIINSNVLYIYNLSTYTLQNSFTDSYFSGINKKTGRYLITGKGEVYILNTTKEISIDTSVNSNSDSDTEYSKMIYVNSAVRPGEFKVTDGTNYCQATIPIDTSGNSIALTNDICACIFGGSDVNDFKYDGYEGGLSALISGTEERNGSIIYFENNIDLSDLYIEDSLANRAITIINKKVSTFGELPINLKHPITVEITGEDSDDETSLYYKYEDGSWKESYKVTYVGDSEIFRGFDNNDMPRVIKNDGAGVFTNNIITYKNREVGNETNNPLPLFVNGKINDMFIYQNRLCFLSNKGISFSEIGDFTNFFRNTVRTLINYDAFNYETEISDGLSLKHSVTYNERVILFDGNSQYTLLSKGILGSNDIYVIKSTNYKNDISIKPLVVNNYLFFTNNRNNKSNVYKYMTNQNSNNSCEDITYKVPNYLEKDIKFISSFNLFDITFFGSESENVFILIGGKYWSKWVFGDIIKNIHNSGTENGYFITQNCLYSMDLTKLGGSSLFENIEENFIDDTDDDTGYNYIPLVELSKIYIPSEINGISKPQGNYRLKQLNLGSFDEINVIVTDNSGSYNNINPDDGIMELQSDLKNTKIEIKANEVGFYFTSISIDLLYTDETIDQTN